MRAPKLKWLNYLLVLTLFNVSLHLCYVYFLLQAHDSMDHTASNIYTFEQVGPLHSNCRPCCSARGK